MWRPTLTIFRNVILPSLKENTFSKVLYSTKTKLPKSTAKITLLSASVGVLIGAGYGGYTHYKVNIKKRNNAIETVQYSFLKEPPEYKAHYKVLNESDTSHLELILFQYRTCPFCCKVRTYLDAKGINYEVVEVDAVLRQAIKWSGYKKVPILLAKVENGYQQLLDSTAIISVLETYLRNKAMQLCDIIMYYPITHYSNDSGKEVTEIVNKYFVMHTEANEKQKILELEEQDWRKWADSVLVHTLSPNVYRTTGEAIETFKWFEEVGGWRDAFPAWEVALMVYGGAAAMWIISKRLKKRHNIKDDERQSLYDAANNWMSAIQRKGTNYLGGDQPNLADISVFGVLSSIEGCRAFQDLRKNTSIGNWFDNMKKYLETTKGRVIPLKA